MPQPPTQFWIDVGGTFTDCIARSPGGELSRYKLLSSAAIKGQAAAELTASKIVDPLRAGDPEGVWEGFELTLFDSSGKPVYQARVARFEAAAATLTLEPPLPCPPGDAQAYELRCEHEAPVVAIRYLLGKRLSEPIGPVAVRLGTTRGTNALLTRRGAKTALVATRGFADVLAIGYQDRPRLFDLAIHKPPPLYDAVIEIDERVTFEGEVLQPADPDAIRRALTSLRDEVGQTTVGNGPSAVPLEVKSDRASGGTPRSPFPTEEGNRVTGNPHPGSLPEGEGANGIESLAICLLHSVANDAHERLVGQIARELGFAEISLSSQIAPVAKLVSRGDTTVVDAYLNPVLRDYVARLRASLGEADLWILTSAGGLVRADHFVGKDSILSGPAGGVVGFSRVAQAAGFARAIGFDMGGTSTDVARFDGQYELEYETEKAGVRVVAPMMSIETVAAGGGSVCGFDGVKLFVGPDTAGADPGPACYGRGGPLAVTDLNVVLGKIPLARFPFALDLAAAEARLAELCDQIDQAAGRRYTPLELAAGFLEIANANMARAIHSISIAKGVDPRDYVLVAFGGAAAQHACDVARGLGIGQILNHPDGGLLSAYGIGLADVVRRRSSGVYKLLSEISPDELAALQRDVAGQARDDELREGIAADRIEMVVKLDLRYRGLEAALTVALPPPPLSPGERAHDQHQAWREAYHAAFEQLYGYAYRQREIECVAVRAEAIGGSGQQLAESVRGEPYVPRPADRVMVWFEGQELPTPLFAREDLRPGAVIDGPAIVAEPNSTTVIEPLWRAEMLSGGELLLVDRAAEEFQNVGGDSCRRSSNAGGPTHETQSVSPLFALREIVASHKKGIAPGPFPTEVEKSTQGRPHPCPLPEGEGENTGQADPVLLELFNNHFAGAAEQMGITLRNTASSVNVKERLDFSCAVFTADGDLVANAPHIPVHLGAMGETVRRTLADNPTIQPGDVFVTNDPYRGGSHLPDVTVVSPVHDAASGRLIFFTASRAHHAEIGGVRPGSMPPFSKSLAEEGVLIRNFKLVDGNLGRVESREDALRELLTTAPYPTRNVEDNLADIAAQAAANTQGAHALKALCQRYGLPTVQAYMRHIQDAAERKTRAALARLPDGTHRFADHLDDGSTIAVAITIDGDAAVIDFSGTSPVLAGNLNANRAIVTAAIMYVLRLLLAEEIPLNAGVLGPIRLVLPTCLLNPPEGPAAEQCAAVAGGNVETSQRVVDVLLGALQLAAASQGTMNNLLFGDGRFGYYETLCGGSGATAQADGADAVHTHMTNTRLTDVEVLERRYPVRVRQFSIRTGSGGAGTHRGGDGVVRKLEFLRELEVSLLSQRRGLYPPYGFAGGQPGALGRNTLLRAGQQTAEQLAAQTQFVARPGDVLTIETPGGGGYGAVP